MFALTRGLVVSQQHPITTDYIEEIQLLVTNVAGLSSRRLSRVLIDRGAPLAILQIVRAPDCFAMIIDTPHLSKRRQPNSPPDAPPG